MDVSNASGYDGTTVAADACFIAKHVTGRTKVVLTEATNPQVRQVVKTYAPGFGLEVVEVPHRDGTTDPDELRAAAEGAACAIFQHPNFFGVLEPAPELAAAANDAGALAVAHVDPLSLGVLEAPGHYGCAIAIGEGQSAGTALSYGGPHYGFLAARADFIRRMPGRIVGETTDAAGNRGYVLTLQTREQHIRREKATSNITTNQTLLALGGLVYLSWLGPQGLRELGETCMAPRRAREGAARAARCCFQIRQRSRSLPSASDGPRARSIHAARERGRASRAMRWAATTPGSTTCCSSRVTEKRTPAEIDRLAEVLARCSHVKLIYEKSRPGRRARRLPAATACRVPDVPAGAPSRRAAAAAGAREPELVRHFTELSTRNFGIDTGFYPLGSCTMKHNPRVNERLAALPGFRDLHPLQEEEGAQGALELMWRAPGGPRRDHRPRRRLAATGRRLAGRADRADADARLLRRPRRGRTAAQDRHPGHRARNQPGERDDGRLRADAGQTDARGNIDLDDLAARSTSTPQG